MNLKKFENQHGGGKVNRCLLDDNYGLKREPLATLDIKNQYFHS